MLYPVHGFLNSKNGSSEAPAPNAASGVLVSDSSSPDSAVETLRIEPASLWPLLSAEVYVLGCDERSLTAIPSIGMGGLVGLPSSECSANVTLKDDLRRWYSRGSPGNTRLGLRGDAYDDELDRDDTDSGAVEGRSKLPSRYAVVLFFFSRMLPVEEGDAVQDGV